MCICFSIWQASSTPRATRRRNFLLIGQEGERCDLSYFQCLRDHVERVTADETKPNFSRYKWDSWITYYVFPSRQKSKDLSCNSLARRRFTFCLSTENVRKRSARHWMALTLRSRNWWLTVEKRRIKGTNPTASQSRTHNDTLQRRKSRKVITHDDQQSSLNNTTLQQCVRNQFYKRSSSISFVKLPMKVCLAWHDDKSVSREQVLCFPQKVAFLLWFDRRASCVGHRVRVCSISTPSTFFYIYS